MSETPTTKTLWCIPVYNDWDSAALLLEQIGAVAKEEGFQARVLLVDDGSSDERPASLGARAEGLAGLEVLELRRNLGHQRAITVGLAFACAEREADAVVVMDGDGQDAPHDVPRLVEEAAAAGHRKVVFAKRARRSEGLAFRASYTAFKVLHRLVVGRAVEVGNFSLIPWAQLPRVVGISEIWNHYAAGVFKARIPTTTVAVPRAERVAGRTKMNVVGLVVHGLSAMSVWGEQIGVRLLLTTGALASMTLLALAGLVAWQLVAGSALPAWLPTVTGLLLVLLGNALLLSMAFAFTVLQGRNAASFLPLRDYEHYVHRLVRVR